MNGLYGHVFYGNGTATALRQRIRNAGNQALASYLQRRHITSLASSSGPCISMLEVVFAQRHHHRPSYTVVDCRRSSFSGRRCTCLERTTTPSHVCTAPAASFRLSSEDIIFNRSFHDFLQCLWSDFFIIRLLLTASCSASVEITLIAFANCT